MKALSVTLTLAVVFGATNLLRPLEPASAPATVAGSYAVDGTHSSVIFRVKHMDLAPFFGRFNAISGTFDFDPEDASKLSIDVSIKAESVDTNASKRDNHLKGPDFFNAKEFPTIHFKSKSVAKDGSKGYRVTGDLSLHGVTRPVTVSLEHTGSGSRRGQTMQGFHATFTIKRSDFGMSYMLNALGDEVTIMAGIEGGRS